MTVISDTTPLISLIKIGKLDLLARNFGEVTIPLAVFEDLTRDIFPLTKFANPSKC